MTFPPFSSNNAQPPSPSAGIIDHHEDRGLANDTANPRIVRTAGSCSSLVTEYLLDNLPGLNKTFPPTHASESMMKAGLPLELVELLLRTSALRSPSTLPSSRVSPASSPLLDHLLTSSPPVAIDSSALSKDSRQPVDLESAERLFPHSSWKHRGLKEVMKMLDKDLSASRKALDDLDLRSLLRRDWKGDRYVLLPSSLRQNDHLTFLLRAASSPSRASILTSLSALRQRPSHWRSRSSALLNRPVRPFPLSPPSPCPC